MCRFTVYLGPPLRLSSLLLEPSHSLIRQSYESRERAEPLNGDGFGVGWYVPELTEEPAVFRSVSPAWNNENLRSIAPAVCSPCIFAHIRAATMGTAASQTNCHPFRWGRMLFMHNGGIGGFERIRRRLLAGLSDPAFEMIQGNTDTEHLFAVLVDELLRDEDRRDPAVRLARCLHRAVRRVMALAGALGDGSFSALNLAASDGEHAVVCRYTDAADRPPESLYYLRHELYEPESGGTPRRRPREASASTIVSSERLTEDHDWRPVSPGRIIAFDRAGHARSWAMDGPEPS